MLSNVTKTLMAGALMLAAASLPMVAAAQDARRTFTVINESHYRVNHLYVSPSNYGYWGDDRLGRYVLAPGYQTDVPVEPGWYDVKLVDHDGDSCVVANVDFRGGDSWTITDIVLLACEWLSRN